MNAEWIRRTPVLFASALIALALVFAACDDDDDGDNGDNTPTTGTTAEATAPGDGDGDGDGEEAAIEETIEQAVAAWNAGDTDTFLTFFTEEGAIESFGEGEGTTIAQVREVLPQFIGSETIGTPDFEDTQVDGDAGETTLTWTFGNVYERKKFLLVQEGGAWKIDAEEDLDVEVPEGVTAVEVDLDEFSFTYDTAAAIAAEELAFSAENVGEQDHEIALARIPADADLNELLMSEEEPPGVEFLGGTFAEPGDSANLVFVEPLGPGRYVMVCFLPDTSEGEDGQPHALLGMVSEFTIE